MSSVRMCDKCKTVFSELEDGWQTFTATTNRRNAEGEIVPIRQLLDACPSCAMIPEGQFTKEIEAKRQGEELQARIAKLEREAGMTREGTFKEPAAPVT